ncbi:hypothetical protein N7532_011279 [Penicillium argentinense]|uniref:Metallo-beta-lactamase domain-containing protein n=1 Tax=Penicillium argentinense TaxID=1131581 RepID=A0A9W9EI47_9EURO|nr:uncharacterized protein N7532_011279 [Penicillium argentinense]KAJ5082236.1 hypothetical protein N7532_011279 [Penicillium argentinense]
MQPIIHTLFESKSGTWQYVVACPNTKEAAIIDPVLDYEPAVFTITSRTADSIINLIVENDYTVTWILETHAHADHLAAAYYIQSALWKKGQPHAPICIGENITIVQRVFAYRYNVPEEELEHAFDHLFQPDETFQIGDMMVTALHLPGHTPDHMGYHVGTNIFTGDCLFNPDVGSARCDFPGGDARVLYRSIKRLLSYPPETKLYTGHDYPPANEAAARDPIAYVTVGEQNDHNKHVKGGATEDDFVRWRNERDHLLADPRLVPQAMQVNVRGGKMPGRTHDGKALLLYPVIAPKGALSGIVHRSFTS